jgi:hemerythrin-like domain-containing protein
MDPIQIFLEEHQLIRKALENLTLAMEMIENDEKVSPVFFEKWREFYLFFILDYHHFKEEYVMFRELAQKQKGTLDAQIDALRYQHERGRNFMNEVNRSLKGYEKDDPLDTSTLLENIAAYVSLIRHHIHREEQVYYPMIVSLFSEAEKKGLADAMQAEIDKVSPHTRRQYQEMVNEMAQQIIR